jgi:regulator of sigma E protease
MSSFLHYGSALLLIAILVTIHEFGHFVVARLCGVHVRVFSIGFGPRLLGFVYKGTDYRLSAIPFGGYVRMAGADPFGEAGADEQGPSSDPEESELVADHARFMGKPAWQRLLISLAGPAFNLVLPVVVFSMLYWIGEPQARSDIEALTENSPAAIAGVKLEDRILAVNNHPVNTWFDVLDIFEGMEHRPVSLELQGIEGGPSRTVSISVDSLDPLEPLSPAQLGIGSVAPDTRALVDDPTSPAGKAGLTTGAILVEVAGTPVSNWNEVKRLALQAAQSHSEVDIKWIEQDPSYGEDGLLQIPEGAMIKQAVVKQDSSWQPVAVESDDALWRAFGLASAGLGVKQVSEGSAAERAGIQEGDRLLSISSKPVGAWGDVVRLVMASSEGEGSEQVAKALPIQIRREGQVISLEVLPDVVHTTDNRGLYQWRPQIGVMGYWDVVLPVRVSRSYPLVEAVERGTEETVGIAGKMLDQLGKLLTGEAAPQKSLGGPLEIVRQSAAAAERGAFEWARLMAVFSISLGILNLLPVPVLDGGQAMMYLAEWLRGRPLPLRMRELALQAGVIFLVLLTLMVLVFDIHRTVTG